MSDERRTLRGLYNHKKTTGLNKKESSNDYKWLYDIIFDDEDKKHNKHIDDIYKSFKNVFPKSEKWHSNMGRGKLFNFDKTNMETIPRKVEGEVPDKIRFWNLSYGMLGKPEKSDIVNAICQDIRNGVKAYTDRLEKDGTIANIFINPIRSLLKDVQALGEKRDPISEQSYRVGEQVYTEKAIRLWREKELSFKENAEESLKASVFTEVLILCLLFGTIDAKGNWEYLQRYIQRRLLGEETIDFSITSEDGVLFDTKEGTNIINQLNNKKRYVLCSPGGAGKSYALNYIRYFVQDAVYIDLNSPDTIKKLMLDMEKDLKDIQCSVLLVDSLNEIMYNPQTYVFFCREINKIENKTVIVASRLKAEAHDILKDFVNCELKTDISVEKAEILADGLSISGDLRKILRYPLYYKMAMSMREESDRLTESISKKNTIKTRWDFFCRYLKRVCKPSKNKAGFLYANLFILPRLAAKNEYGTVSSRLYKDRIEDLFIESTGGNGVNQESSKDEVMDEYARRYIITALGLIGYKITKLPLKVNLTQIEEGNVLSSELFRQDRDAGGFTHETVHHFMAALDYAVRFRISAEYALGGDLKEYRTYFGKNTDGLLINNSYSEIDEFLLDFFGKKDDEDFVEFFDRISNDICGSMRGKTIEGERVAGILSVMETSVEIAVVLDHHKKLNMPIYEAVRKYSDAGLILLKKSRLLRNKAKLSDTRLLEVLGGLLERDLQYYRLRDFEHYMDHVGEYGDIFDLMKNLKDEKAGMYGAVVRNQLYKYDQVCLENKYEETLSRYGLDTIIKAASQKDVDQSEGLPVEQVTSIKTGIDRLISDLEGNIYEMSYNLLAVMTGFPNISLLSLGYERDVRQAFVTVARMIRQSRREGTFLQFTYAVAYRLLVFDVKIKDGCYDKDVDSEIYFDDLEVRDCCVSKAETATVAYLEHLRDRSGGLAETGVKTMQLIAGFLLGEIKSEDDRSFISLDKKSGGYLPYMTLKYCMRKGKEGGSEIEYVSKDILRKKIDDEITVMLNPDKPYERISFEKTNRLYNIMSSLKLIKALELNGREWTVGNLKSGFNSSEFIEMFMKLIKSGSKSPRTGEIISKFFKC